MIDIGANLTNRRFDRDRALIIAAAQTAGVKQMIVTGTSLKDSAQAVILAREYPGILYATAGCHPHEASEWNPDYAEKIEALATQPEVVAIGECGLDFKRNFSTPEQQLFVFDAQLKLASRVQKPLFVHQRDAHHETLELLKKYRAKLLSVVVHCFTDGVQQVRDYLALDCHIGVTGWVTDTRRNQRLLAALEQIPDERLMLETDAPYLLPHNLSRPPKDRRCTPAMLPNILTAVAQQRGQDIEVLAHITTKNSQRFFQLPASA